ncbi:hypothetical protein PIB30_000727 [Stylosanthes scabra]|uniref:F-box domain-containing protein n=1 Tax=Stylosanthes scabra TaxID=79078 RepID=A0ABU6Z166_9FABA|nr:hypothetical protein [Stylosanthes scabra]
MRELSWCAGPLTSQLIFRMATDAFSAAYSVFFGVWWRCVGKILKCQPMVNLMPYKLSIAKTLNTRSIGSDKSSMEKKHKSMNDILPVDLIHRIFLMVPAKQLGRLRCVSKLWQSPLAF